MTSSNDSGTAEELPKEFIILLGRYADAYASCDNDLDERKKAIAKAVALERLKSQKILMDDLVLDMDEKLWIEKVNELDKQIKELSDERL